MSLKKVLMLVFLISVISLISCSTIKSYSKECLMELHVLGFTEEELLLISEDKRYKTEYNDLMIKEGCE